MAKPSKKGAKSEAEVVAEAKRKKEILDKVAQSNLPTKTILKELGISRSTYYSWLKRYEEEGEDGLLDSRSQAQPGEEITEAAPEIEETEAEPAVQPEAIDVTAERPAEPVAQEIGEEKPESPPAEKATVKPEEPVAQPLPEEPKEEIKVSSPAPPPPFGGGETKRGFGGYAFVAVLLLAIGLLVSISLSNYNTYKLVKNDNTLSLYKGKFAPRGFEQVESFEPVVVGDSDVSGLTNKLYTGKAAVYKAIFAFYMDQVTGETSKGDKADMGTVSLLLDRVENFMESNGKQQDGMAAMRFDLARQRVAMAELGLQKAYQKALPIYQEALKAGVADRAMLEAKIETMEEALGRTAVSPEAEEAVTPPATEEITEKPATPVAPEGKSGETVVAPQEEIKQGETGVSGEPAAEVGKGIKEEQDSGATSEPTKDKDEATTEKPEAFRDWLKSKRSQL
jgi:transposase-like protein